MNDRFANDAATWTDPRGRALSARIWRNRRNLRNQIDFMIADAIVRGDTVEQVSRLLERYIKPSYARAGSGKARYAANRLASNEMLRANALAARDTALTNPAGGFLRYMTGPRHIHPDQCTGYANHSEGFGRGVYPAKDCPMPPIHVGCDCRVIETGVRTDDMDAFVDQLRVEYDLADPPDLSPSDLSAFRRETARVRQGVQIMFKSWLTQTGLVDTAQLLESNETVRAWVEDVRREKRRRQS